MSIRSKYAAYSKAVAGGIMGLNNPYCIVKLGGNISTDNLVIEVSTKAEADGENLVEGYAGGCFGYVREQIIGKDTTFYEGLKADSNVIRGMHVGGLVGATEANSGSVKTMFQAVSVSNGTLTGDGDVGGLVGHYVMNYHSTEYNAETALDDTQSNVISNMQIIGKSAGGAFGYVLFKQNGLKINNLIIRDSVITATTATEGESCSAGGLIGETECASTSVISLNQIKLTGNTIACELAGDSITADRLADQATGGVIGRILATSTAGEIRADNFNIDSTNRIGICNTEDTDVQLLKKYGDYYILSDISDLDLPIASDLVTDGENAKNYHALESLEADYGYCVGTIIGASQSAGTHFYLMRSDDDGNPFTIPVMDVNPPVTDVGSISEEQMDRDSDAHYRKYVHIIYGAPVAEANDPEKNIAFMNTRAEEVGEVEYPADGLTLQTLLGNYRYSEEEAELMESAYATTYTYPGSTQSIGPVLVYKPENGTLQEVLESFTNIMTNIAGASASDIPGDRLIITTKQKLVAADGTVTDGAGTPSIQATITDGQVTYTSDRYDGLVDGKVSYTELTFLYTYGNKSSHQKEFVLPVFVEEPILYGVHMQIMEGSATSVDNIKQQGVLANGNVQMASDSDYTLLLEYSYGDVREKMPDNVITDKAFYLTAYDQPKAFAVGTKLRLIDVMHGNKPYYYTVEQGGITELRFSQFEDGSGNAYVNSPINELASIYDSGEDFYSDMAASHQANDEDKALHQLEDAGVERYLLTVMNDEAINQIYKIHTDMYPQMVNGTEEQNKGVASLFAPLEGHEEMPWLQVTAVPGLIISLNKENSLTDIAGEISKEGNIVVKATFKVAALDPVYWQEMSSSNSMDSENNGKYLEIGFYLRDSEGNRVPLPDGTNYSYLLGDGSYSENKVMQDSSLTYYYKDIRELFEKENSEYKMDNLTGDIQVTVEFKLTFAGADLSQFTEENYEAWIELLRTANRDYPMGVGNMMDSYKEDVTASYVNSLGFAIRALDIAQLAINTYPVAPETNTIDYQTMFDFSSILERISGYGEEVALNKWAGYDYEVTYQMWKKTANGYVEYTGDDIIITMPDGYTSINGAITTKYNFSADEIANGNAGKEGLIVKDGSITVHTANLVDAGQANLTNYKIMATLQIKENGELSDDVEPTTDFFVYTVTKLKTDLSEE